jgi:hypothetical protein
MYYVIGAILGFITLPFMFRSPGKTSRPGPRITLEWKEGPRKNTRSRWDGERNGDRGL